MESEASNVPSNLNMTIPIPSVELVSEILSRLPVKFLLKFRSVSKSWLSLISSSEFIKNHLNLSANNKEDTHHVLILDVGGGKWNYKGFPLKSLFYDSVTEPLELDFPIEKNNHWHYVKGSCNGLVYLSDYCLEYSLLWNPTTRKHKDLPPFRPRAKKTEPAFGFGYDELHDDYKVVIISYNYTIRTSDDIEVKVYSLKSDSWTSVDYCDEGIFFIKKSPGYCGEILIDNGFLGGKLYWGTSISDPNPNVHNSRNIMAFDLANEKWEKVEEPSYGERETELLVGKLGSDLCVFIDYKTIHIGVWVMKEYEVKESWINMFTIPYPNDPEWFPNFFMSNKGKILSVSGATFMIYNSTDDSFRYSCVTNCHDGQYAQFYLESLVCPLSTQGAENAEKAHIKKSSNK
ncbi:F-box protein CPR1-like [Solanum dulcamara]|uniref:F-box protein CPR1-like n=1 Tax=Solanum dulcamara TaxID=45834 RepID=UPI002486C3B3|nr:F-box protein CPR1-like [Solanum dulcamara]